MKKKKKIAEWIRTAIEWLRCPSCVTIRRKIVFHDGNMLGDGCRSVLMRAVNLVEGAPRSERRLRLNLMLRYNSFVWSPEKLDEIVSFINSDSN